MQCIGRVIRKARARLEVMDSYRTHVHRAFTRDLCLATSCGGGGTHVVFIVGKGIFTPSCSPGPD